MEKIVNLNNSWTMTSTDRSQDDDFGMQTLKSFPTYATLKCRGTTPNRPRLSNLFDKTQDRSLSPVKDGPTTPKQNTNFVKRLVATLEKKSKLENHMESNEPVAKCFYKSPKKLNVSGFIQAKQQILNYPKPRETLDNVPPVLEIAEKHEVFEKKLSNNEEVLFTFSHEEVERISQSDQDPFTDYEDDISEPLNITSLQESSIFSDSVLSDEGEVNMTQLKQSSKRLSFNIESSIGAAKKSFKKILSSMSSWKIGKRELPKGSREYYSARESLGEELRAFRKDMQPTFRRSSLGKAAKKEKNKNQRRSDSNVILFRDRPDVAPMRPISEGIRRTTHYDLQDVTSRELLPTHPAYASITFSKIDKCNDDEPIYEQLGVPRPPLTPKLKLNKPVLRRKKSFYRNNKNNLEVVYDVPRASRDSGISEFDSKAYAVFPVQNM